MSLDNVSFSYQDGKRDVLSEVTIFLPRGSVVAMVGRNGAGKSTLANILLGVLEPSKGSILLDGKSIPPLARRNASTGVFQDFLKPGFTLREAVGLSVAEAITDDARLSEALGTAGGALLLKSMPKGLDTQLTEKHGYNLSHGQWQTVAVARSLVRNAPILRVLDEPSSALDAFAEQQLFATFVESGRSVGEERGAISILISHRYSVAPLADLVIVVEDGKVVSFDTHEKLMADRGEYYRMYSLQTKAYEK